MRAQFATMEALASLLVAISAISFVSAEISLNSNVVYVARSRLTQDMAMYDVFKQMAENRTTNGCVSLASATGDARCLDAVVDSYRAVFGIKRFYVALPGASAGSTAGNGTRECVPVRLASLNGTGEVCVIAGD